MTERWKDVVGYEGIYKVSNIGRVKSLNRTVQTKTGNKYRVKGKILKVYLDKYGYSIVSLRKNGKSNHCRVHRLMCIAFKPNPLNKPWVNHKDGSKSNNVLNNLEWSTPSENAKHAYDKGLNPIRLGEKHHNSKLTTGQVKEIVKLIDEGSRTFDQIGGLYGVSKATIGKINTGMIRNEVTGRAINRTSTDMRVGACNPGAKSVVNCRGEVYPTLKEAALHYSIDPSSLTKACKGKYSYCGKYSDGSKIRWKYKERGDE